MIRTLIIEDEQLAAHRLEKLLKGIEPEIEVVGTIDTAQSAVRWLESHPNPDLIMLDIQLGDGLSFDIFNRIKVESYVIFTTAYDEYAIRAFELNSIDYLLKPVSEQRLEQSITKYKKLSAAGQIVNIQRLLETVENLNNKYKKRFVVTISGKIKIVETGDVAFFYSKEKNTFLCSGDKRHYPVEFSLDQLETMLNPEIFFRVNRQYIVQYKNIAGIDVLSKSRIRISTSPLSDEEIYISAARTSEFRQWLER
jgi:two-component system, LytTR family, response regulator LytT